MLIRLKLLRHCPEFYGKWPTELLESNKISAKLKLRPRYCSDIKRNEELLFSSQGSGIIIPTPLKIKQTIKSGFYEFVDGFACIQTSCPTCPSAASGKNTNASDAKSAYSTKIDEKCLFINKTTGLLKTNTF